jgi:demethylspheroidene O-methyltransferase
MPPLEASSPLRGLSRPDGPLGGGPGREATWLERWRTWRDQQLTSPGFRRWASRFWLTRPIARRRASQLFDLMAGFVYSQVLAACVELRLFDLLADGAQDLDELARRTALPAESLRRLLDAAVSLELVERRATDRYGLGPLGAPIVGDEAIAAMVRHHAVLYADLRDPLALLRNVGGGDVNPSSVHPQVLGQRAGMSAYWPYADGLAPGVLTDAQIAEYSSLMSASQPLVGAEVTAAMSFTPYRHLLDVGGGEGRFLTQVGAVASHLQLTLFDLPAVAARGQERLAAAGLSQRSRAVGGDFIRDPLPEGADLISLVRVLFDHPDERCRALLAKVHRSLPDQGAVLIAEPMAGVKGAERMGDAYYNFYLLAMGHGRARTPAMHTQLLLDAGFARVETLPSPMPLQATVLLAHKR